METNTEQQVARKMLIKKHKQKFFSRNLLYSDKKAA